MKVAGYNPNSFIDYGDNIAAVVFTPGCNLRCRYCHNRGILENPPLFDEDEILKKIARAANFLDGVVISGGEPTLQEGLEEFVDKVRALGLKVKLDTNGLRPSVLAGLIERGKLDYIAMDIKAPIEKYPLISPGADGSAALSSIKLIMESGVDHEFRTTFYPELTPTDIEEIAKLIAGAKRYFLQQYNPTEFCKTPPHTKEMLNWAAGVANKYVNTKVRGN